jgi:hypothetical protein
MNSKTAGKLTLPNGGVYEGEILDGKPNGKGIVKFDDGETFEGMFINGVPNGKGKQSWADGAYIDGEFENGRPVGDGKMYKPGVGLFEGPVSRTGKCKITYSYGNMPEGSYYVGDCVDGKRDGWGTQVLAGLNEETGEWRGGRIHGYSVGKLSDAGAAQFGATAGWTGEGITTQGKVRYYWIKSDDRSFNDGKPAVLRATDGNFDIPQEDLPLGIYARLFMGFIEMYKEDKNSIDFIFMPYNKRESLISELNSVISELESEKANAVYDLAKISPSVKVLEQQIEYWQKESEEAFYSGDEEWMELANHSDLDRIYAKEKEKMDKAQEVLESIESNLSSCIKERDSLLQSKVLDNLLTLPIEQKAEVYYDWLVEKLNAAQSESEYTALAKKFSDISEYKDCAKHAEKCKILIK